MKKLLTALLCLALVGCAQVDDGEVGIKKSFGRISDDILGAGWHFINPFITDIEVWNVKTQELKETASVPSSEGLISSLDISVLYSIPKDKASFVRKSIGRDYVLTVLEPYVREAIRNIASGYAVKALYSDAGRKEIGEKILAFLHSKLDERGIIVQDILLCDVRLPEAFTQSIQAKLNAEQQALQKEFELLKAKKDAEIEVAKAEGIANSNHIIASSISESYLKYKFIEALAAGDHDVIYVPTEANLPILEANRFKDSK